jgi:23S rRNA (guanine745-N1)-methyltransferase
VDAGCGERYYSDRIAAEFSESYVFGVDLSKHAVHRASVRRNLRGGTNSFYAVSSVFTLPVKASAVSGVLSMFAPIAEEEYWRVLNEKGIVIVGAAGDKHLYDLKNAIYEDVRINELRADLPTRMKLVEKTNVTYRIFIDNNNDILKLFGMTPYKFRTSAHSIELLNSLETLETEVNVDFYVYRK